jgi:hypothetical protein
MEKTKDLLIALVHEIEATLITNEFGGLPHEVFLEWCIDELTEAGETEDLVLSNFDKRGEAVHGYSYSDHDGRLDLFITSYKYSTEPYTIQKNELETLTKRMSSFVQKSYEGKNDAISVHEPASDLVQLIKSNEVTLIRMFVFTDGKSNISRVENNEILHFATSTQIWDIERFLRLRSSGNYIEATDITVSEYGEEFLPCSSTDTGDGDITTYLCLMPGEFLANIYREYSSRLLERNVRSFLSFKTGTNKGILRTIADTPDKFIAYNNGLTATATKIELDKTGTKITKMSNFQIVNGGQTTNAIYRAKYSSNMELSGVFVQLKLCVLNEDLIDEFGPKISEYANTQNAIKKTDLTANNPVYREIEKISRTMYAPASDGLQTETKWFFERARGQYNDSLSMLGTPAQKKKFEREFPRQQKIDKAQLAKYWGVWYQQIVDVSLGPEKYHPTFIEDIERNKNKFDSKKPQESYQKLVAMAVLYKTAYAQIRKEKYGYSFPGVTTDYSIALISNLSGMRLDLLSIWKDQSAPVEFITNIDFVSPIIGKTIIDLVSKGYIPKELAKGRKVDGKTLWQILREENLQLPAQFKTLKNTPAVAITNSTGTVPLSNDQEDAVNKVLKCGSDKLWALTSWAKETDNLQPWQRGIIASVAKLVGSDKSPSGRQAVQTIKALNDAEEHGFKYTET